MLRRGEKAGVIFPRGLGEAGGAVDGGEEQKRVGGEVRGGFEGGALAEFVEGEFEFRKIGAAAGAGVTRDEGDDKEEEDRGLDGHDYEEPHVVAAARKGDAEFVTAEAEDERCRSEARGHGGGGDRGRTEEKPGVEFLFVSFGEAIEERAGVGEAGGGPGVLGRGEVIENLPLHG